MPRDQVIDILVSIKANLKSLGVHSLAVFGSVAKDEATTDSDVDVLIYLEPPIMFWLHKPYYASSAR
ncbi:hypothetical protein NIES2101_03905 [Calothrix sp. HK-06]|nr:hypothetical protein NIES2101_03905 [Calothrix sp. HK-06]